MAVLMLLLILCLVSPMVGVSLPRHGSLGCSGFVTPRCRAAPLLRPRTWLPPKYEPVGNVVSVASVSQKVSPLLLCAEGENSAPNLRRWDGTAELPYIDNFRYRNELNGHVNKKPSRQVLLVYGPRSVGKTRTMLEEMGGWRREGGAL
uniref:ATPase domain-containing protein n=1 Tax=Chromera velia CCMP2878 TaxID=1169474 RepID=A0A0G4GXI5_9ALVE|eukprot:Cvel_5372.t1-p1 / transcript=Cvel_5372.t1 / gene=Cvel_5372 / organism=Chromera_velia_CCMP2878 / gene_product=hypothetical protein / transcript_product=hypothetical protein / location=Cvel_scaffold249:73004-73444(-) / protein_length=147 / sequence_SO=supercontig / SO=protein_coding / is_pseudo=false